MIAASQNDFEEFGVDQSTLDEMKQVCDEIAGAQVSAAHLSFVAAAPSVFISLSQRVQSLSSSCQSFLSLSSAHLHRRGGAAAGIWVVVSRPKAGLSSRAVSQSSGAPSVFGSLFYSPCAGPRPAHPCCVRHSDVTCCCLDFPISYSAPSLLISHHQLHSY